MYLENKQITLMSPRRVIADVFTFRGPMLNSRQEAGLWELPRGTSDLIAFLLLLQPEQSESSHIPTLRFYSE